MTLQEIIGLAVTVSMFLIVFSLGLEATLRDALSLFRRPSLLFRSILAMNGIMLALAVAAVIIFDLPHSVEIALLALAASPVPPVLPGKQQKAGGTESYAVGLLCAASLIGIVLVPAFIWIGDLIYHADTAIPVAAVARVVFTSIMLPLGLGILAHRLWPDLAHRMARPLALVGTVLLVLAALPVIVFAWPVFRDMIGSGVVFSLIAFTVIGTFVGHLLGGPDPDDRTVLALATGARHPAVAMALASITVVEPRAILALVLYHLIIATLVVAPYVVLRTRTHRKAQA